MSNHLEDEFQIEISRRGFFCKLGETTKLAALGSIVLNNVANTEKDPSLNDLEIPALVEPPKNNLKSIVNLLNLSPEVEQQYFGEAEKVEPGTLLPKEVEEKAIKDGRVRKFPDAIILHIPTPYGHNSDNIIMFERDSRIVEFLAVNLSIIGGLEIKDLASLLGDWDFKTADDDDTDYYVWMSQGITGVSDFFRGPRQVDNLWLYKPVNSLDQYNQTWGHANFPSQTLYY